MSDDRTTISVLVGHKFTLLRQALTGLLQVRGPAWRFVQAETFGQSLELLEQHPVDLMVLDLQMPGLHGVGSLRRLRREFPEMKIVVLSDTDDNATILACLTAGVHGFLPKSASAQKLQQAIDTVLNGGVFLPATLAAGDVSPEPAGAMPEPDGALPVPLLTDRQRDVLRLLAEGCTTKTIARRLELAVGTVKVHLAGIYRALGARNRLEALVRAGGGRPITRPDRAPSEADRTL
jgi:DNA-binding NarL/FixJ family response regulator